MAKPDSNTIVDVTQDPALQGLGNTKTTIKIGPLPDSTYVDKNVQIINNPGGNTDEVQFNSGGSFAGDNGLKYNKSTDQLTVKGNLNVGGWVKGKIFTNAYNFFLTGGNSGQVLSTDGTGNLSWVDQSGGGSGTNYSNSNVSAYLATFTGNVAAGNVKTDNLLYSNGVAWNFGSTYANSNVANYLPTYTGNVAAGNVKTDNLLYANGVAWDLNGTYSNSNVANYLPSYDGDLSPTNIHVTTNSLLGDNATANSYYVYRDSNQVSLGQLGANTIDINSSGITITSNNEEWKFSQDGLLHLAPTGIRFADSSIQSTAYLGISNIIQDGNSSVEVATDANVSITANTKGWTFDTDGNITLPEGGDILDSNGESVLGNSVVFTGVDQPNTSVEGTLWFNSDIGKTYVKYDGQWVDSNPQTIDARALRTNLDDDVEIPKHTIYTNGRMYQDVSEGMSSIRWVNVKGTSDMELLRAYRSGFENDDETGEVGQIGVKIQDSNLGGVYIKGFNGEDEITWTFDGTGNITFPDDTVQTTAFQPATLLDGGGANSTYTGNYQPGSIPNPFDQELNTNDIVQFANVTAGYFIGDGSQLTNIPASNANTGNVTFSNQTVIGTGDVYGGGGLYLALGPDSVADLQYFRVRGGDNPTHLHFDTGNNEYYDQYFGDDGKYVKLEAGVSGAVVLGTNNNAWTFANDGNLTLPTNTSAINYANGSSYVGNIASINLDGSSSNVLYGNGVFASVSLPNVTTDNIRINGEERGLIVDAGNLKRFGFMKYTGIEGSLVHSAYTGAEVPLRIGRTSTQDVTAANVDTFTTEIYVGTNGHVRIADDNVNNINDPTERLEVTGNIKVSGGIKFNDSTTQTTAFTGTIDTGNVTGLGNISTIDLDGNASNILFGNGVFAAVPNATSLGNLEVSGNVMFNNASGTPTGFVNFDNGSELIVGTSTANAVSVYVDTQGTTKVWTFGTTGTLTTPGNVEVSGAITATNLGNIVSLDLDGSSSNVLYGNGVFAPTATSYTNSNVSTFLASFGSNNITTTGNITANNFTGNFSITGNVQGTSPNVTLIAGSYSATFDNTGVATFPGDLKGDVLISTNSAGDEGGEIQLAASENATIDGVIIDSYNDILRIFENGGTSRGVRIDLTKAPAGVGGEIMWKSSGLVNAGTYVTLDLLKATLTSTGNRGLSISSTTGSFTVNIGATYSTATGGYAGSAAVVSVTTTPSTSLFSWNFVGQADTSTYIITDTTNSRTYRVLLQIGASFINNFISIERLL